MRIVVATEGLGSRGGVHSYLDAILPELVALGHEVHVVASRFGRAEAIHRAGGATYTAFETVPGPVDGILGFVDSPALRARAAFPEAPLVFVSHGPWYAQDAPPAAAEPCAVVALSDRSAERLRGTELAATGVPIVRLTQPAEFTRPTPPDPNLLPEVPRHAVIVSHRMPTRTPPLEQALAAHGIDVQSVGGDNQRDDAAALIRASDIVIGIGRVVLEGMVAERACLVLDERGGADWLTPATYPEFEATGFLFGPGPGLPPEEFGRLLERYRRELGRAGRELAARHHAPSLHATRLVQLLADAPAPRGPFDPGALRREADARADGTEERLRETLESWEMARVVRELREALTERDRELAELKGSASWRLTAPLRRAAERRRRR